jgi:hypothetical protein
MIATWKKKSGAVVVARLTMGRQHDDGRHRKHKRETEEERLLRKAREYIEQNEKGDEKRKDKKKRKSSDRKRGNHHSDDDSRSRKKRRKESDRKDKKYKRKDSKRRHEIASRHEEKGEKTVRVKKSDLYPLGALKGSPPAEPLDLEKDYFAYHQHLWVYLYREEGIIFGDLTSEDARSAFSRFAKRYNAGELEESYYGVLPQLAIDQCQTTRHKWSFNTSETERESLRFLEEGVRKQTQFFKNDAAPLKETSEEGVRMPEVSNERRRLSAEERTAECMFNRRLKEHVRTVEEELKGGRKDGRERQIEKRKETAAKIHGAAKDREEARMGGVELNDEAIYGGGGDGQLNFQDALSRERHRNAQRQQKNQDRIAELKKKEQDKQDAMIKMMGLTGIKPGQKITIAPRKDA